MNNKSLILIFLLLFVTSACSLGDVAPAPAEDSTLPPTTKGSCGDGDCTGPENAQTCPEDCSETGTPSPTPAEEGSAPAPAIPPADLPASVFVVHCEPTNANEQMWIRLIELVTLADTYNIPLSIDFTAQWAEMILGDYFKQQVVESWLENGHEIGGHHHAYWATKERGATWDGYTNTPKKELDPQDRKKYEGNMDAYMELLNALPGERTSGAMGSTSSPEDEIDWPCQIIYGTAGYAAEDGASQPQQVTIGECQITQIGHALIVPRESGELEGYYANTDPDSIFGVIGHVFNYDEFPTAFEAWFKFLYEQDTSGERRFTVSGLLEDW